VQLNAMTGHKKYVTQKRPLEKLTRTTKAIRPCGPARGVCAPSASRGPAAAPRDLNATNCYSGTFLKYRDSRSGCIFASDILVPHRVRCVSLLVLQTKSTFCLHFLLSPRNRQANIFQHKSIPHRFNTIELDKKNVLQS
jgi:hypothetical protein